MIASFLLSIGVVYALFIFLSWLGWKMTKSFSQERHAFETRVSIIVPARNEEESILHCLNAIAQQSYPKNLTEVIVSDDTSEDRTVTLVKDWIASHPLNVKIISSSGNMPGKKHALNEGIKNATGELIVTTDADCTMNSEWLPAIVSYYEKYSPAMICGMAAIREENNLLSAFQSLEQHGLTAIGVAGIYFRQPLLCNGANLAYQKKIFEETGGYNPSIEAASGDDTLLMFRIAKQNPRKVHFLKSKEAIVYTNPASTAGDFFNQRKRWGSKVLKQKNVASALAGLIVFLFHASLVVSFFLSSIGELNWHVSILLLGLKIIPEILLMNAMLSFTSKKNLWQYVLLSQLIYPVYLVVTAFLSQTGKYVWKRRTVR